MGDQADAISCTLATLTLQLVFRYINLHKLTMAAALMLCVHSLYC
jgi:hypothetical protein